MYLHSELAMTAFTLGQMHYTALRNSAQKTYYHIQYFLFFSQNEYIADMDKTGMLLSRFWPAFQINDERRCYFKSTWNKLDDKFNMTC